MPDEIPARSTAGNAFYTANALVRWATRTSTGLARKLPGAGVVETELGLLERAVLGELRRRLDSVDPLEERRPGEHAAAAADPEDQPRRNPTQPPPRQTEPLRVAMAELLMRSMEQTRKRAREYLYLALLRQLVPDEARILAALADGSVYPVVHVESRSGMSGGRRVLSNASTVGRAAGVSVTDSVPRYLTRLLHVDLVELGDADDDLGVQYEILMTDATVRDAEEQARAGGRVRMVQRTVRIAPLGRDLWDACHPRDDVEAAGWVERAEGPDVPVPARPTDPAAAAHVPDLAAAWPEPAAPLAEPAVAVNGTRPSPH